MCILGDGDHAKHGGLFLDEPECTSVVPDGDEADLGGLLLDMFKRPAILGDSGEADLTGLLLDALKCQWVLRDPDETELRGLLLNVLEGESIFRDSDGAKFGGLLLDVLECPSFLTDRSEADGIRLLLDPAKCHPGPLDSSQADLGGLRLDIAERMPKHADGREAHLWCLLAHVTQIIRITENGTFHEKGMNDEAESLKTFVTLMSKRARARAGSSERPKKRAAPSPSFMYFGSGSTRDTRSVLSNFSGDASFMLTAAHLTPAMLELCPEAKDWLEHEVGWLVCSSEHLWQALDKAGDRETFHALLTSGWGSALEDVFPAAEQAAKIAHWRVAKRNMVGILVKMAVDPRRARSLGLVLRPGRTTKSETSRIPRALLDRVWADILTLKFTRNPAAATYLTRTAGKTLIELETRPPQFWGACYKEATNTLVGQNVMGEYLMAMRARLLAMG